MCPISRKFAPKCWMNYPSCRELSKETNILLQFKNKELETSYEKQRESMSSVPLIASVLIHVVASVYSSLILPSSFVHFLVVIAPIILTIPLVWISAAESFPMVLDSRFFNANWGIIHQQSIICWLGSNFLGNSINQKLMYCSLLSRKKFCTRVFIKLKFNCSYLFSTFPIKSLISASVSMTSTCYDDSPPL